MKPTEPAVDPHRVVLISDLHVDADRNHVERDANMADNLARTVTAIASLHPRPAYVIINGDLAHWFGNPEDYVVAITLLQPIRDAGVPMYYAVGNHDHRENLWKAFPDAVHSHPPVPGRQITLVESPRVDWYLLDSLLEINGVPGSIGEAQLAWLAQSLGARPTKPAIVMSHHQPDFEPVVKGLIDTQALLDVISPRKQVKALFYGHTHRWVHAQQADGMHWVNIPTTGYVFYKEQPTGWVDVALSDRGATLQLICLNSSDPQHLQKRELIWR